MLQKPTKTDYYARHYSRATEAFKLGYFSPWEPLTIPEGSEAPYTEAAQDFMDGQAAAKRDAKDYI